MGGTVARLAAAGGAKLFPLVLAPLWAITLLRRQRLKVVLPIVVFAPATLVMCWPMLTRTEFGHSHSQNNLSTADAATDSPSEATVLSTAYVGTRFIDLVVPWIGFGTWFLVLRFLYLRRRTQSRNTVVAGWPLTLKRNSSSNSLNRTQSADRATGLFWLERNGAGQNGLQWTEIVRVKFRPSALSGMKTRVASN